MKKPEKKNKTTEIIVTKTTFISGAQTFEHRTRKGKLIKGEDLSLFAKISEVF